MDEWNNDYTDSLISFEDFHSMCDELDKIMENNVLNYYDGWDEFQSTGDMDE